MPFLQELPIFLQNRETTFGNEFRLQDTRPQATEFRIIARANQYFLVPPTYEAQHEEILYSCAKDVFFITFCLYETLLISDRGFDSLTSDCTYEQLDFLVTHYADQFNYDWRQNWFKLLGFFGLVDSCIAIKFTDGSLWNWAYYELGQGNDDVVMSSLYAAALTTIFVLILNTIASRATNALAQRWFDHQPLTWRKLILENIELGIAVFTLNFCWEMIVQMLHDAMNNVFAIATVTGCVCGLMYVGITALVRLLRQGFAGVSSLFQQRQFWQLAFGFACALGVFVLSGPLFWHGAVYPVVGYVISQIIMLFAVELLAARREARFMLWQQLTPGQRQGLFATSQSLVWQPEPDDFAYLQPWVELISEYLPAFAVAAENIRRVIVGPEQALSILLNLNPRS